jgi:hypothetical protein
MSLYHVYTQTVADGTATSVVRPSDWNSAHAQQWALSGNTSGSSLVSGLDVVFVGGNNVTVSADTAGSKLVWSVGNYLTTAMASNNGSNFVQATAVFNGTNASGTISSNAISVSVAAQSVQPVAASANNGSFNFSTLSFSNANGVSFGTSAGSALTASVNTSYRASNDAVGLNTALTAGPLAWTVNSSGISLNAASAAGTTSGFAGNQISGSMTFNTAGLNLSLNHPAWLSSQSNQAFSAAGGSSAFQTLVFTNSNGVSWTNTNGSVAASVKTDYAGTGTGLNLTNVAGTLSINTAGVSLSLNNTDDHFSAWSLVGNTSNANSYSLSTEGALVLEGGPNITLSGNSNTIVISGGGGVVNQTGPNIAAGGATVTSGTVVFSNSNNITFGLNNSTLTASYADPYESYYIFPDQVVTTMGNPINGTASVVYMPLGHNLKATRVDFFGSVSVATNANNSSAALLWSATAAFYSQNGNTLSSIYSTTTASQATWSSNVTGSVTGVRLFSVPLTISTDQGYYFLAIALSTRATGQTGANTTSLGNSISMMGVGSAQYGAFTAADFGSATTSSGNILSNGLYSGTTNFATIGLSNITFVGTPGQRAPIVVRAWST